jgi:hypothetical protein
VTHIDYKRLLKRNCKNSEGAMAIDFPYDVFRLSFVILGRRSSDDDK